MEELILDETKVMDAVIKGQLQSVCFLQKLSCLEPEWEL